MFLCSRQINSSLAAADLVKSLKSVRDLRALVLPKAVHQHGVFSASGGDRMGARGQWFTQAMAQLRTLLYIDPQVAISVSLADEPWQEVVELVAGSLQEAQLGSVLVGRIVGDDLTNEVDTLRAEGCEFAHVDTGRPLAELTRPIHSVRVGLGAAPYVHAVAEGCRLILGGIASAGALTMGFLHSDQRVDRYDWNTVAQLMLHAVIAEQQSLAVELTEEGIPSLHPPPATAAAQGIVEDDPLESRVTRAMRNLEAVTGQHLFRSPDIEFASLAAEMQAGPHGGITLHGVRGSQPSQEMPVEIIYRAGATSELRVTFADQGGSDLLERVRRELESLLPLARRLEGQEGALIRAQDESGSVVPGQGVAVDLFGLSEAAVSQMYGVAYELLAKKPGCVFHTPEIPKIHIDYQRWPSTVPRRFVEWDVEIRAAADWA